MFLPSVISVKIPSECWAENDTEQHQIALRKEEKHRPASNSSWIRNSIQVSYKHFLIHPRYKPFLNSNLHICLLLSLTFFFNPRLQAFISDCTSATFLQVLFTLPLKASNVALHCYIKTNKNQVPKNMKEQNAQLSLQNFHCLVTSLHACNVPLKLFKSPLMKYPYPRSFSLYFRNCTVLSLLAF